MATTQLSHQIFRPSAAVCVSLRRRTTEIPFPPLKRTLRLSQNSKWAVRLSLVQEQSPPRSTVDVQRLVDFLYDDLPHLFDDQGIDRTAYDEQVMFRDPITKHDSISGYLFNISLLKLLFRPDFFLHWVKQVCICYIYIYICFAYQLEIIWTCNFS